MTLRRAGSTIFAYGIAAALALAAIQAVIPHTVPNVTVRHDLYEVGLALWCIGIIIGGPLWIIGAVAERRSRRRGDGA